MKSKDIREIRAALVVVRESETIIAHLNVSVISSSSREALTGTKDFLCRIKKSLWFQLMIAILGLSDATVFVLKDLWSCITKVVNLFS